MKNEKKDNKKKENQPQRKNYCNVIQYPLKTNMK